MITKTIYEEGNIRVEEFTEGFREGSCNILINDKVVWATSRDRIEDVDTGLIDPYLIEEQLDLATIQNQKFLPNSEDYEEYY